jgi:hypothetical protein
MTSPTEHTHTVRGMTCDHRRAAVDEAGHELLA